MHFQNLISIIFFGIFDSLKIFWFYIVFQLEIPMETLCKTRTFTDFPKNIQLQKLKSRFLEGYLIFPPFFKQNYEFTPSIPHVCGTLGAISKIT